MALRESAPASATFGSGHSACSRTGIPGRRGRRLSRPGLSLWRPLVFVPKRGRNLSAAHASSQVCFSQSPQFPERRLARPPAQSAIAAQNPTRAATPKTGCHGVKDVQRIEAKLENVEPEVRDHVDQPPPILIRPPIRQLRVVHVWIERAQQVGREIVVVDNPWRRQASFLRLRPGPRDQTCRRRTAQKLSACQLHGVRSQYLSSRVSPCLNGTRTRGP